MQSAMRRPAARASARIRMLHCCFDMLTLSRELSATIVPTTTVPPPAYAPVGQQEAPLCIQNQWCNSDTIAHALLCGSKVGKVK